MNGTVRMLSWLCAALLIVALALPSAAQQPAKSEDELIAVLTSDAGWQPKYEACTALRQVGTVKSVPALASLLTDEKLSHMARYALEPMSYPEATEALRKAVAKTNGLQKVGVISALGVKRDAKAVKIIAKELKNDNADIARAAAGALGRIGTPSAAAVLRKFASNAPDSVKKEAYEGLLAAGENLAAAGDTKLAVALFSSLQSNETPEFVRLGALRGLAKADPANAGALLAKSLASEEPAVRNFAATVAGEVPGDNITGALVAALPTLPPAGQAALLRGLGERKDPAARAAVVAAMSSGDANIRLAAVTALSTLGTAADVPALAKLLVSDNTELAQAARMSLVNVEAEGVDAALAAYVAGASPAERAAAIDLLSDRAAAEAVPIAVDALADSDPAVRAAALDTLAQQGTAAEVPAVIAVLTSTADANERSDASDALNAISSQAGDAALPLVTAAMQSAGPEARAVLLRSLGRIGSPQALDVVVAALRDKESQVANEAASVLANWPSVDAAPHLLKLAQSKNPAQKDAALRGFVRLAESADSAETKAKMLSEAMSVAKRPEEKWLVLPAWGKLPTKQSLDTLSALLDDPQVRNEAAAALITAATEMAKADAANKPVAAEAVNAVVAKVEDPNIKERAQKALESLK